MTYHFWPDELPWAGAAAFAGARLMGHQRVMDAYLPGLAARRGGRLATLDAGIGALTDPNSPERAAIGILD